MIKIRPFQVNDAEAASKLIERCLYDVNIKTEALSVIQFIHKKTQPEALIKIAEHQPFLVAEDTENSRVLGTVSLENDYLTLLHVHPEAFKRGIGKQLVEELEKTALENRVKELFLVSSPFAYEFYLKMGYKDLGKQDFGPYGILPKMAKKM